MLAVPADRLPDAIGDLDPGNRALLDLSLRRGVSDAEIGELLRKEPADVARGRDAVLELLADALDVGGHDRAERIKAAVAALPDDAWQARGPATAPAPPRERAEPFEPGEPAGLREPDETPEVDRERDEDRARAARKLDEDLYFEPEPQRSRRGGLLALLGLLAVVAALVVAVLVAGDDDDSGGSGDNGSEPAQNSTPAPSGEGTSEQLSPLGGGKGSGEVTVTDEGATITLRDLPNPDPGTYQVWLYDSIVNSQSLGTVSGANGELEVKLPPEADQYRYLDVSHEPPDANPNHSGDSVLRAPLSKLLSG
jgi:hypothetical protein